MTKLFTVATPIDLKILATNDPQPELATTPCVAMIICHGMGQQVPFETLDAVAMAITDEHRGKNTDPNNTQRSVDVVLRFVRPTNSEKFIPRAEITLKQDGQADKTIHLYEAYWAPLTEGVISYTKTAIYLLCAGCKGLRESCNKKFSRWMFGGEKSLPIEPDSGRLLLVALLIAVPLLALPIASVFFARSIVNDYRTCACLDAEISTNTFILIVIIAFLLLLSYFIRKFVVQYMGDVIIYVSSNEVNCFWKVRDEIKQIGLVLAKVVYGAVGTHHNQTDVPPSLSGEATEKSAPNFLYSKIVVVGHSLGSVIAYDTLNAIINQDQLDNDMRRVVDRTEVFITLGSPLDKIAFLFRQKAKNAFTRDMLAAAYQPMILDYKSRPRWWINVFCKRDFISGSLEYFDDPDGANTKPCRVRNFSDPYKWFSPVTAHTDYWKREPAKTFLYLAATGSMEDTESESFQHNNKKVGIRSSV